MQCDSPASQAGPRAPTSRPSYQTSSARTAACFRSVWRLPELRLWLADAVGPAQPRKVSLGVAVGLPRPAKAAWASLAGYVGKPRRASDRPAWHLAGCERRSILRVEREPRERSWAPCRRRRTGCWRPRDWTVLPLTKSSSLVTSFYRLTETVVAVVTSPGQTAFFSAPRDFAAVRALPRLQLIWENWSATIPLWFLEGLHTVLPTSDDLTHMVT